MPRNGSGVFGLPPGSTFTPLTLADANVVNAINNDFATDANTPRPIVAGGTGASTKIWEDIVVYAAKSGNYTAVGTDNNAIHNYTATATATLTAAATLLSGWHYTVIANNGPVTIDPNASETINGQATLLVPNGAAATIVCDGANFFTTYKPNAWDTIGVFPGTGAASLNITNLASYRMLRFSGLFLPSTTAAIYLRVSNDNGVTWLQGASEYITQYTQSAGVGVSSNVLTAANLALTTNNTVALTGGVELSGYCCPNFNVGGQPMRLRGQSGLDTGSLITADIFAYSGTTTARNAIQFYPSTGTITYYLTLEGIRG